MELYDLIADAKYNHVYFEDEIEISDKSIELIDRNGFQLFSSRPDFGSDRKLFLDILNTMGAPEYYCDVSNWNGFLDWMKDLGWIDANKVSGVILLVHIEDVDEYSKFKKLYTLIKVFQWAGDFWSSFNFRFKVVFIGGL